MTARATGNANQAWIKTWLEERGWIVRNFPVLSRPVYGPGGKPLMKDGRPIFSRLNLDVFGADLLARKADPRLPSGGVQLWIQAQAKGGGVKKRQEEFARYFDFLMPGEHLQLWTKAGTGAWNIQELPITEEGRAVELGKIIRRKWYAALKEGGFKALPESVDSKSRERSK